LLESASCCLPMAATYRGSREIKGLFKLEEITTTEVISKVKEIINNYDTVKAEMKACRLSYDWIEVTQTLSNMYYAVSQFHHLDSETIKAKYVNVYNKTTRL